MPETESWQASLLEQRTAWGIAACCITLVFLASARPEWFEFREVAPQQHTVKKSPSKKIPLPPPVIQHHPVETHTQQSVLKPKIKTPPVTTAPKTHVSKASAIAGGFYVQVGAFHERPRARGLTDRLKKKGWSAVISVRKNGLYAVWIGPKKTSASAGKLLEAIQRKLKIKGFIVHQKNT